MASLISCCSLREVPPWVDHIRLPQHWREQHRQAADTSYGGAALGWAHGPSWPCSCWPAPPDTRSMWSACSPAWSGCCSDSTWGSRRWRCWSSGFPWLARVHDTTAPVCWSRSPRAQWTGHPSPSAHTLAMSRAHTALFQPKSKQNHILLITINFRFYLLTVIIRLPKCDTVLFGDISTFGK